MKEESVKEGKSTEEYLLALQKEYICLIIREKIYLHENDQKYFQDLMAKKREKINSVSRKYQLPNIFQQPFEYKRLFDMIVPDYGLPNFIYNIVGVEKKQLKFPYKGTVVRAEVDGSYHVGITQQVDFDNSSVDIKLHDGTVVAVEFAKTKRLNHQETDEFYYFYPGSKFQVEDKTGEWTLVHYDLQRGQAYLEDSTPGKKIIMSSRNALRRVL
jgi:hypothetical protein